MAGEDIVAAPRWLELLNDLLCAGRQWDAVLFTRLHPLGGKSSKQPSKDRTPPTVRLKPHLSASPSKSQTPAQRCERFTSAKIAYEAGHLAIRKRRVVTTRTLGVFG